MSTDQTLPEKPRPRFRATLIRVLIVQAIALTLLGLIQIVYNIPAGS